MRENRARGEDWAKDNQYREKTVVEKTWWGFSRQFRISPGRWAPCHQRLPMGKPLWCLCQDPPCRGCRLRIWNRNRKQIMFSFPVNVSLELFNLICCRWGSLILNLSKITNTTTGALKSILPLLAWLRGLALEGTCSPLLEFGWCLLVGGSCDGCVCHFDELLQEKRKTTSN